MSGWVGGGIPRFVPEFGGARQVIGEPGLVPPLWTIGGLLVEKMSESTPRVALPPVLRRGLKVVGPVLAVGLTVWSAILAKELGGKPPLLASVDRRMQDLHPVADSGGDDLAQVSFVPGPDVLALGSPADFEPLELPLKPDAIETLDPEMRKLAADASVRWFDGRPVRPARIMTMEVTAYSPDAKSCGKYADGKTATLHSVETNGFALVAADPTVLKYGSMITVPGYDHDHIVPVLDCGSDIKGRRLDLLFPTDAQAKKWGRKTLKVIIWQYADGKPAPNPRRLR